MPAPDVTVRALLALTSSEDRGPVDFPEAVVWAHGEQLTVGSGGWSVEVHGEDRLHRLSALWRAAVESSGLAGPDAADQAGDPVADAPAVDSDDAEPRPSARAWISSTFSDTSEDPALLRVPAYWATVDARGGRTVHRQAVSASALAVAVAADGGSELLNHAVTLPAAGDPGAGWTDADYAAGIERLFERFAQTVGAPAHEQLHKVVLSRTEEVPVPGEDVLWDALERLRGTYPQTWVFSVGGLFGATPEMLATRTQGRIESLVLAGSIGRGADEDADRLARERLRYDGSLADEHRWAVESVLESLDRVVELDDDDPDPTVLTLPNVHHLATRVSGVLRDETGTVLDVVARMHPTAAVGGTPTPDAVRIIRELEPLDRGRYAGPVGWIDEHGDGEIALALRCGQLLAGETAVRLHAGGGIVPGSHPEAEVAEVGAKLAPMRRALAAER